MHRIVVNVQTGEVTQVELSDDEITQSQNQYEQVSQANAQWQLDHATELRRAAYIAEADPLFFKAQRGEATLQEWQDKVEEIKARYPYE
jgi:hypothetical protein